MRLVDARLLVLCACAGTTGEVEGHASQTIAASSPTRATLQTWRHALRTGVGWFVGKHVDANGPDELYDLRGRDEEGADLLADGTSPEEQALVDRLLQELPESWPRLGAATSTSGRVGQVDVVSPQAAPVPIRRLGGGWR